MKLTRCFSLMTLLFTGATLAAQIKIVGEMWLGDTTQNHTLVTPEGTRFEGRVLEFGEQQILFLQSEKRDTLRFSLEKVLRIEVEGMEKQASPLEGKDFTDAPAWASEFLYLADESGEDRVSGTLENYSFSIFRLKKKKSSTELIHRDKLIRLQLTGASQPHSDATPKKLHVLRTKERKDRFVGQVLSSDGVTLRFLSLSGTIMQFSLEDVFSIYLEAYREDLWVELNREMPKLTGFNRIFITPSAFSHKKGMTEYRNIFLYYNSISFAPSDHFNIELVPLLPVPQLITMGNMKWTADVSSLLHAGLGAQGLYAFKSQFMKEESFGVLYGMASVGDEDHYVNFGLGRGDASFMEAFYAYFMGGSVRLRPKLRFSFEYIVAEEPNSKGRVYATFMLKLLKKRSYYELGLLGVPYKRYYIPVFSYNLLLN